jgi:hypothetical protein
VYVVVVAGLTVRLFELMVTPLELLRLPLVVVIFMLVAPLTDQLSTLLSPLVMVAGVAVKLAIWGTSPEPNPAGLPAVPHPQFTATSRHARTAYAACFATDFVFPINSMK